MPTYNVHYPQGLLSAERKQSIAAAITQAHSSVTGAQRFFCAGAVSRNGWTA